jgi:hypothetical protein
MSSVGNKSGFKLVFFSCSFELLVSEMKTKRDIKNNTKYLGVTLYSLPIQVTYPSTTLLSNPFKGVNSFGTPLQPLY